MCSAVQLMLSVCLQNMLVSGRQDSVSGLEVTLPERKGGVHYGKMSDVKKKKKRGAGEEGGVPATGGNRK